MDCMTPEERETAKLQNVIYKRGEGLAFIGIQYPNRYETGAGSASDLERRITEIRSQKGFRPGAARGCESEHKIVRFIPFETTNVYSLNQKELAVSSP